MKYVLNFFIIILIISASCDSFHRRNFYDLALKESQDKHKLLLLDFTAVWCGGCKAYDKYVFQDSAMVQKLSERFVLLKVNRDKPENLFLIHKYRISGLPHIVIADDKEHVYGSINYFDSKYVDNPDLFYSDLTDIINSQKEIRQLDSIFKLDTTNIESITKLLEKYQSVNQYLEIGKLNSLLVHLNPTPERLYEYKYNQAIYLLQKDMNVEPLLSFIQEYPDMDYSHKWGTYSQLLYHYEDIGDIENQDAYFMILIKLDPEYFKHKYAEFLFENKIKIDTAIALCNEYNSKAGNANSFWGQFLNAHKLACSGNLKQAVQTYSSWMEKNSQIWISGEDYWILYFYAKFADSYNVDLNRALDYIRIAERNRNMIDEKVLMAEILYKLGKVEEALIKLREALNLTDSQNEYKKITVLIEKYNRS
jgi:tetratricopeptide (TPR) repeat protein